MAGIMDTIREGQVALARDLMPIIARSSYGRKAIAAARGDAVPCAAEDNPVRDALAMASLQDAVIAAVHSYWNWVACELWQVVQDDPDPLRDQLLMHVEHRTIAERADVDEEIVAIIDTLVRTLEIELPMLGQTFDVNGYLRIKCTIENLRAWASHFDWSEGADAPTLRD